MFYYRKPETDNNFIIECHWNITKKELEAATKALAEALRKKLNPEFSTAFTGNLGSTDKGVYLTVINFDRQSITGVPNNPITLDRVEEELQGFGLKEVSNKPFWAKTNRINSFFALISLLPLLLIEALFFWIGTKLVQIWYDFAKFPFVFSEEDAKKLVPSTIEDAEGIHNAELVLDGDNELHSKNAPPVAPPQKPSPDPLPCTRIEKTRSDNAAKLNKLEQAINRDAQQLVDNYNSRTGIEPAYTIEQFIDDILCERKLLNDPNFAPQVVPVDDDSIIEEDSPADAHDGAATINTAPNLEMLTKNINDPLFIASKIVQNAEKIISCLQNCSNDIFNDNMAHQVPSNYLSSPEVLLDALHNNDTILADEKLPTDETTKRKLQNLRTNITTLINKPNYMIVRVESLLLNAAEILMELPANNLVFGILRRKLMETMTAQNTNNLTDENLINYMYTAYSSSQGETYLGQTIPYNLLNYQNPIEVDLAGIFRDLETLNSHNNFPTKYTLGKGGLPQGILENINNVVAAIITKLKDNPGHNLGRQSYSSVKAFIDYFDGENHRFSVDLIRGLNAEVKAELKQEEDTYNTLINNPAYKNWRLLQQLLDPSAQQMRRTPSQPKIAGNLSFYKPRPPLTAATNGQNEKISSSIN